MNKVVVGVSACLLSVFAVAAWVLNKPDTTTSNQSAPDSAVYFDETAATEERIRALEIAVGEERNARQLLEEELLFVLDELDRVGADRQQRSEDHIASVRDASDAADVRESFRQRWEQRSSPEVRTQALIDAGFSPDRAAQIMQREAEMALEVLQARFEAGQPGQRRGPSGTNATVASMLRAEIGDSDYEMYLEANNRPTSVGINSVMPLSPAQTAGLQPGDQIVRYDGQRVFSFRDINAQTTQGSPGQSVLVDIERDGSPMQIVLPRGPLGIRTSRR